MKGTRLASCLKMNKRLLEDELFERGLELVEHCFRFEDGVAQNV